MKHQPYDLKQMQSLPLEAKIMMSQQRIRQWEEYWDGEVYVSISGKDSTVLKHVVDNTPGVHDVPAVFVNTGLEYPEVQKFIRDMKSGKFEGFNTNIEILRPEMRFDEVLKKYGYPVVSKEVADAVSLAKRGYKSGIAKLNGTKTDGTPSDFRRGYMKWKFLVDAPFMIGDECCFIMKKYPVKKYEKSSGRKPFVGTLACESAMRKTSWMRTGCNAFDSKRPISQPIAFWTEQDVLEYLTKYNVPYPSVYGEIKQDENGRYYTTGCDRTGCMFCAFGAHCRGDRRFLDLKQTHPRQYDYCINGGEMVDGKWQPSKDGLGLWKVLDYIGVDYK